MKGPLQLALGVMTAVGGFVDIGNIVTSGISGARYGMTLTFALVLGTIGMVVYGEMAGRVAAVAQRPVFHAVRERLGARMGLVNLVTSGLLSLLTLAAEIGGVSLTLQLATGLNYLILVPIVGAVAWLAVWRLSFSVIENLFGLLGLALVVFIVALFLLPTNWSQMGHQILHPAVPFGEGRPTWWFYAISLFGAALIPYQVIFFASGGREEKWTTQSIGEMRMNALVGFPLGGVLSLAIMAVAVPVLQPIQADVSHLGVTALPIAMAAGRLGIAFCLLGFFAATFAATAECALSVGYSAAQFFGWRWGKEPKPVETARFHAVVLLSLILATAFILTSVDPITVTLVSVVLGAGAVPLTYFPVLIIANDRAFMGRWVNKRLANTLGTIFLIIMVITSIATVPLLFVTKAGL